MPADAPERPRPELTPGEWSQLLQVARGSIAHGLRRGKPLPVDPGEYPEVLQRLRASFVTLHLRGQLRGCIGVLEAIRPLVDDVAKNAYAAAFSDPRFEPLREAERQGLDIHISVLSPSEPMRFTSEQDLVRQVRPGVDGLILADGSRRGTFLPSVWESLPDRESFLRHLKLKAGLPPDYWSETIQVSRYTAESYPPV